MRADEVEPAPGTGPRRVRSELLRCLAVALGAILLLALHAEAFEWTRLHIHSSFGDQAGYITTARGLADTGELRSGILYPAHVLEPGWRPYMPGHYLALAGSYVLFGFGVLPSLLPSLIGYVLGSVAVYLLGSRRYGAAAGFLAALGFAAFPVVLLYAFTAMAELGFVAAGLVAMTGFVLAPPRWRPWLTAPLLAIPFCWRETGSLYVVPMVVVLLHPSAGARRYRAAVGAVVGAVVLLASLQAWQVADGKGQPPLEWVDTGSPNYFDAFAPGPDVTMADFAENLERNLAETVQQVRTEPWTVRVVGLVVVVALIAAALVLGCARWGRDPFPLGAGLLGLAMLAMLYVLYDVKAQKGVRSLLFVFPLCAVAVVGPLAGWARERVGRPRWRAALAGAYVVLVLAGSRAFLPVAARSLTSRDELADANLAAVEAIGHDPAKLLVAPLDVIRRYAVEHYPVRASLVPANERTFALIFDRYDVGTVVLPLGTVLTGQIPATFLTQRSFYLSGKRTFPGLTGTKNYLLYEPLSKLLDDRRADGVNRNTDR